MSIWDDRPELVTRLRDLAADGNSYEIIGRRLSTEFGFRITKNQVLSKAYRIGLAKPKPVIKVQSPRLSGWKRLQAENRARNCAQEPLGARSGPGWGKPPENPRPLTSDELEGLALLAALDAAASDVPASRRRGVADLDEQQCRWPIGDPQNPDFHFCDLTQTAGLPYCVFHARRAYRPWDVKPQRPDLRIVARTDQIKVKA